MSQSNFWTAVVRETQDCKSAAHSIHIPPNPAYIIFILNSKFIGFEDVEDIKNYHVAATQHIESKISEVLMKYPLG